jgi:hypothetical protein
MTQPAEPNLSQSANELTEAVGTLTASVRKLASDSRRSRRLIYLTIAGLILDLSLTIVVGVLFNGQRTTNHKIQNNARNIEEVLHSDCPFFKDLGTVNLPVKATTFGIKLVADSRTAYYTHSCPEVSGKLGKPDPRLLPYLPPYAQ